ncbi:MAG: 3-deoxy-manno-octulosonate cytidylyltransferase [Calditrichaeota bacterium]|nr:3-deoxy-manno-octulosonate cytidylyltransferase [Calditrichota bacterium]MBT7616868.1 3-deoxy-manno-octulosonate cytidylyltransferase [Calditrichota bacterium]MBT7787559.1 3-deoxy-manno-octulosonate cytidylyltransferase [Calditrichota bacterium]
MAEIVGIIPARYDSTRLPGKLLLDIAGKSVLERTWLRACKTKTINRVVIASGDEKITEASNLFGAEVVECYGSFATGSDRIAFAIERLYPGSEKPDIVVNIQGDEPLLNPETVDLVVKRLLNDAESGVSTAITRINTVAEYLDTAAVKVVVDSEQRALYFSRSPIPAGWEIGANLAYRHIGLYVYRLQVLLDYVKTPQSELEKLERLEQLRLLYNGTKIATVLVDEIGIGIDTKKDLDSVRKIIERYSVVD